MLCCYFLKIISFAEKYEVETCALQANSVMNMLIDLNLGLPNKLDDYRLYNSLKQ